MNMIITSISVLGGMGLVFGIGLAYASKKFAPKVDPKVAEIEKALPAYNCGACGYAGCNAYAEAVASGEAEVNLCKPGGEEVSNKLGDIMGSDAEQGDQMVSQRFCNGGKTETKTKYHYNGIKSCRAASLVNDGFKQCYYSCLGLSDCERVCPVDAIKIDDNMLPQIDKGTCIGCEKCVIECPKDVLHMVPKKSRVHVRCHSINPGRVVVKVCKVGCIACKKCEKECPFDAIHVIDNIAVIDYAKCKNCTKCVKVCPRKIIEVEPMKK